MTDDGEFSPTSAMAPSVAAAPLLRRAEADNDAQIIALWLHGRSEHTQRAYRREVEQFLAFVAV